MCIIIFANNVNILQIQAKGTKGKRPTVTRTSPVITRKSSLQLTQPQPLQERGVPVIESPGIGSLPNPGAPDNRDGSSPPIPSQNFTTNGQGDNLWRDSKYISFIQEVGQDEFPHLSIEVFGSNPTSHISEKELMNQRIFAKITELINHLPMRRGRNLEEILITHRMRKCALVDKIHHSHDQSCPRLEELDEECDETRLIAFVADSRGLNPLMAAHVELLANLANAFTAQLIFFQDQDCCFNTFFDAEAYRACQVFALLAEEALTHDKHRRRFWQMISEETAQIFHEWENSFNVEASAEEKQEQLQQRKRDDQIKVLENKQREIVEAENKLKNIAEKLAAKEIPQGFITDLPEDMVVFDPKSRKKVTVKVINDRAVRDYERYAFRKEARKQRAKLANENLKKHQERQLEEKRRAEEKRARMPDRTADINALINDIRGVKSKEGQETEDTEFESAPFFDNESLISFSSSISNDTDEDYRNEMDNSMLRASGPSVTNLMIKPAQIPTTEEFETEGPSFKQIMAFVRECENTKQKLRIAQWPRKLVTAINIQYRYTFDTFKAGNGSSEDLQKQNPTALRQTLERMADTAGLPNSSSSNLVEEFISWLSSHKLKIDWAVSVHPMKHPIRRLINEILSRYEKLKCQLEPSKISDKEESHLVKVLTKEVVHENISKEGRNQMKTAIDGVLTDGKNFPKALEAVSDIVMQQLKTLFNASVFRVEKRKETSSPAPTSSSSGSYKKSKKSPSSSNQSATHEKADKPICRGCGWTMRQKDKSGPYRCSRYNFKGCKDDPRRNNTKKSWAESDVGKKWSKFSNKGLPKDSSVTLENATEGANASKGDNCDIYQYCANLLETTSTLIDFSIVNKQQEASLKEDLEEPPALSGRLLLDTGAIGNSVVSSAFYNRLIMSKQTHKMFPASSSLTSAFNDSANITKEITFQISMVNFAGKAFTVNVRALVADINVDLILDRESVKLNNLLMHFPDHFANGKLLAFLRQLPIEQIPSAVASSLAKEEEEWRQLNAFFQEKPSLEVAWKHQLREAANIPRKAFKKQQNAIRREQRYAKRQLVSAWNHLSYVANLRAQSIGEEEDAEASNLSSPEYESYLASMASNFSRKAAFEREGNLTEIPDNKLESIPAELISELHEDSEYVKVLIEGPPILQARLRELVRKHKLVFRSTV